MAGMTLREFVTVLGFKTDTSGLKVYDDALKNMFDKAKQANQGFQALGQSLMDISGKASLFISLPLVALGTASVMAAAKVEQVNTTFEVLTGNAEKTKKLMGELYKFEAESPFNLEEVLQYSKTLIMMKVPLEDITTKLNMLGNVAGGQGEYMQGIMNQLFQVKNIGYASLQDLKPIANNGVPIFEALAKVMKTTTAQVMKATSQQKVSYDILMKAMEQISSERTGLMERQSKTLGGLLSSLTSAVFRLRVSLGNLIVEKLHLKKVVFVIIDAINKLIEKFEKLPEWVKTLMVWIPVLTVAFISLAGAIGMIIKSMALLKGAMAIISMGSYATAAIGLIVAGLMGLMLLLDDVAMWIKNGSEHSFYGGVIVGFFKMLGDLFAAFWAVVSARWNEFMGGLSVMGQFFASVWTSAIQTIDGIVEYFKNKWQAASDWFMKLPVLGAVVRTLGTMGAGAASMATPAFGGVPALGAGIMPSMAGAGGQGGFSIQNINVTVPDGSPSTIAAVKGAVQSSAASSYDEIMKKFNANLYRHVKE